MERVDEGYRQGVYETYQWGVEALKAVEKDVLRKQGADVKKAGTSGAGSVSLSFINQYSHDTVL